jgi:protein-S-isoprenylcysteine O-methyltransferase Ste14
MKKFIKGILSVVYGLVMIEVIIMVSPFAFYWYSLYAPTLQGLHRWRATAWMEAFFLPHSAITTSSLLEFNRWVLGRYAFSLGIIVFLLCAAQVYSAKLLHKNLVTSCIYSRIRHPQYLALGVAAYGLLTMWPRIIILVLFLGMLFTYYFLARFEEKQEQARHSEYAEYCRRTAMFVPGNPGGELFQLLFGRMKNRALALAASSALAIVVVIGGGLLLRRYTIAHTAMAALPEARTLAIATWPMPADNIRAVVSAALQDPRVQEALGKNPGATFSAHVLPADYGMVNMFADVGTNHRMFSRLSPNRFKYLLGLVFPFLEKDLRHRIMGTPEDDYKVVFSRMDEPRRADLTTANVLDLSARMTPVVIADVGASSSLEAVVIPPPRSFWGDITMPMF